MLRTRNSIKRTSSSENDRTKKKKLSVEKDEVEDDDEDEESIFGDNTDEDSDYNPKKDDKSSSDSDVPDGETESKFFKSSSKSSLKNLSKFVEKYKSVVKSPISHKATPKKERAGHNLESDSSSDEFERVPFSLEELGDFKKINAVSKKESHSDDFNDSSDCENSEMKENDYFDFTQIIQRQEMLKSIETMKNESDKKIENEKKLKSEVDMTKETNKRYIRKKVRRNCKKLSNESDDKNSNDVNVMELLKLGEGTSKIKDEDFDEYSNNEESDIEQAKQESKPKNIQVTIELPGLERRKDKKKPDLEAAIKRRFNLIKKEHQVFVHKVHILCWIAHGNYVNSVLNSQELIGIALSLIPSKHCYPPKRCDLNYLEKLVEWYVGKIKILKDDEKQKLPQKKQSLSDLLEEQFTKQVAYSRKDLALLFVCMVRALGLTARLIINLRPVPLKPPANELLSVNNKPGQDNKPSSKSNSNGNDKNSKGTSKRDSSNSKKTPKASTSKYFNDKKNSKKTDTDEKKSNKKESSSVYFDNKNTSKEKSNKLSENKPAERKQPQRGKKNTDAQSRTTVKDSSKKMKLEENVELLESDSESCHGEDEDEEESGENFLPKKKTTKRKPKKSSNDKIDRRVLSTDDEADEGDKNCSKKKKKSTIDEWAEVYLEAEEKWICVDLVRGKIHCTQLLYVSIIICCDKNILLSY